MTLAEAYARVFVGNVSETFEKAYDCTLPQDIKEDHIKEITAQLSVISEIVRII